MTLTSQFSLSTFEGCFVNINFHNVPLAKPQGCEAGVRN